MSVVPVAVPTSRVTSRGAAVSMLALLVASCGSITALNPGDGGPDGGGNVDVAPEMLPLTPEQACSMMSTSVCDALDSCASFLVRFLYGDKATCVSRWTLGCTGDQSVPGTNRTISDLVACARDVTNASCAALEASDFPASCRLKAGMRPDGSNCGSDWQCQSTYCRKTDACGVCGPQAVLGGACAVDGGCQPGLVCAANMRCAMPGTVGAACSANQPCRSDLYCPSANGACTAKVGAGGSCADTDRACDLIQGVACNPINHICEQVNVAKGGNACGLIAGALTICVGFNPCRGLSLTQLAGVCANPAADGAPCGGQPPNDANCVGPAQCVMNICRLPSAQTCG